MMILNDDDDDDDEVGLRQCNYEADNASISHNVKDTEDIILNFKNKRAAIIDGCLPNYLKLMAKYLPNN